MKCTWLQPPYSAPLSLSLPACRVSRPLHIPLDSLDATLLCGHSTGSRVATLLPAHHVICSFSPSAPVNVLFEYYYFDSLVARLSMKSKNIKKSVYPGRYGEGELRVGRDVK